MSHALILARSGGALAGAQRREKRAVAKSEWGLKRTCQSCSTRFYDLSRTPIVCPKCGAVFDPEIILKTRRPKAAPVERPAPVPVEVEEVEVVVEGEEEVVAPADEEAEPVMEDTSELGEDKEDVAEVIENVDKEGEER